MGGNTDNVKGTSLLDDLQAVSFRTVLYPKPQDTPWATADDTEPVHGIGAFIDDNKNLFNTDRSQFYEKIINHYYRLTEEGFGQTFFRNELFTPFKEGTADFEEWNVDFTDAEMTDLSEVTSVTGDSEPDFVNIAYSYGYPDHFYVCLSDPNPENPVVFGTDHEVFFSEVTNHGTLEDFFNRFMTPEELVAIIRRRMEG